MISNSAEETKKMASDFVFSIKPASEAFVVGLNGDLGSGKTTFVKFVAEALGVKEVVTSPTFVIEKIYKLEGQKFDFLIHFDAYRLEGGEELEKLGWQEIISEPKNLVFVEWPENVKSSIPKHTKMIKFKFVEDNKREIIMPNA